MSLPGSDLVAEGLADLRAGRLSAPALLVAAASERLRAAGVDVPTVEVEDPWHRLYALLAEQDPRTAHGRHNALVRRLVSFARAAGDARAA
ncbi:MAG TPA: hypothetical protein VHF89_06465 [Solirubrobacteraceae bacterium]|nr:hypothetical protein [Solirubrobacteraceae bacterium]